MSPAHSSIGTRSESPAGLLPLLGSLRFHVLFHSPMGFFSPFPHGTTSLSVTQEYLALQVSKSFQTKLNLLSWLFYDTVTTHLYSRIRVSGIHPLRIRLREDLALSCLIHMAEWTLMEILLKISEVSFFSDSPEARGTLLSESLHHVTLEGDQDHSCKS
ncbi:hypothetical protein VNO77_14112 [Canavalia gladiata]|uniref:Uncharacterized protein n=1 Tax=Canavalia gladiata TaxID=3824 RepID=A0AAN9LXX4_CANGL